MAHGGAGPQAMSKAQRACLSDALAAGHAMLKQGWPALDAVEATIRVLEASGVFNAGVGSRLQLDGARRMDASIMEGHRLRAGAVAAIEGVRHPISAARLVMDRTAHVLLVGDAATRLARHFKLERQPPPGRVRRTGVRSACANEAARRTLRLFRELTGQSRGKGASVHRETVGALALDLAGGLAAGASTGGVGFMLPGRVGDSPLIGSGVYADNESGAVSMTGEGERIIRIAVAKEITDRLAAQASPVQAAGLVLRKLVRRVQGRAGTLVLAPDGRFAIRHSTRHMAAGYWGGRGSPVVRDRFK